MSKALGTTDEVTTCDCCGKSGLKLTVAVQLDCGEVVHYGTTCAARNTGKTQKQITSEIKVESTRRVAAARAEWKRNPANIAEQVRFAERTRANVALGRASMEFVQDAADASDAACRELAARHGVTVWEVRG